MPLKACAYSKKGMMSFASRNCTLFSSSVACEEVAQGLIQYKVVANVEPA